MDEIVKLVLDNNSSKVEIPDVYDPNNLEPEKINSKNAFDCIKKVLNFLEQNSEMNDISFSLISQLNDQIFQSSENSKIQKKLTDLFEKI